MQEETSTKDLKDRLALIESMMSEGRRTTESWGWTFLLWGIAYMVAILWARRRCRVGVGQIRINRSVASHHDLCSAAHDGDWHAQGKRAAGYDDWRRHHSIWIAVGISMFLLSSRL